MPGHRRRTPVYPRPVDTSWLESFLALVEHGGFTRAAEGQHLSQPAFSRRIRALEQWFGAELVDRSTFPVSLTTAGVRVRGLAIELVGELDGARDEIRGLRTTPGEAVRVAASHTLATAFFAPWWSALGRPPLPCVLSPANTLEAYDSLLNGGCDLLLAYADPAQPPAVSPTAVEWIQLGTDRIGPYAAAPGPRFELPGTEQRPVPFVAHGPGAFLGRVTESLIAGRNLRLQAVARSDLTAAVAGLVREGIGVGWLPALQADGAGCALERIGDDGLTAQLEIRLYRRRSDRPPSNAVQAWESAANAAGATPAGSA